MDRLTHTEAVGVPDMDCPVVPRRELAKRLREKKDDYAIRRHAAVALERDSMIIAELRVKLFGANEKINALTRKADELESRYRARKVLGAAYCDNERWNPLRWLSTWGKDYEETEGNHDNG